MQRDCTVLSRRKLYEVKQCAVDVTENSQFVNINNIHNFSSPDIKIYFNPLKY